MTLGSSVATEEEAAFNGDLSSLNNYRGVGGRGECASMGDVEDKSRPRRVRVVMSKHQSATDHNVITARR